MRLFEHEDFPQAILRAAAHFDLSEQFDGERAMFRGGTSLSKSWGLITRFSDDIDLFVNPDSFDPPPGKNRLDRILKDLSTEVEKHPALTWLREEGETISGLGPRRAGVRAVAAMLATTPTSMPSPASMRFARCSPRPSIC